MNLLPAVVIGGPPHSGKSVLTYALAQALRDKDVQHYILRAAPDGEGLWANESKQSTVRHIRRKGEFSTEFVDYARLSIRGRHLPLVVDVGGRPEGEQFNIFAECTHSILLYKSEAEREQWRGYFARYDLIPLAELQSQLHGSDQLVERSPLVSGVISDLERGETKTGMIIQAMIDALASVFDYTEEELTSRHLARSPVAEPVVLPEMAVSLGFASSVDTHHKWQPDQLMPLLERITPHMPLAIYGRGPNWVYGALAAHAAPATCHLFDIRLGWVSAADLTPTARVSSDLLKIHTQTTSDFFYIELSPAKSFIDYRELPQLTVPLVPAEDGVVISGALPHWLTTTLVRSYKPHCRWVAVFQPQLEDPVVVWSDGGPPVGTSVAVPKTLLGQT